MAKFKKGDRVRVLDTKGDDSYLVGDTLTILENNCEIPVAETLDGEEVIVRETEVELITDYQPITPKVGERYRVVKELLQYNTKKPINNSPTVDKAPCNTGCFCYSKGRPTAPLNDANPVGHTPYGIPVVPPILFSILFSPHGSTQ